jgi:hypothetical protein
LRVYHQATDGLGKHATAPDVPAITFGHELAFVGWGAGHADQDAKSLALCFEVIGQAHDGRSRAIQYFEAALVSDHHCGAFRSVRLLTEQRCWQIISIRQRRPIAGVLPLNGAPAASQQQQPEQGNGPTADVH